MPNVQWMPYLFVRLFLFKCDVCVLNYIWIKLKWFLIILYVFGSDFYHHLFCAYFVFHCFKHVLCWKTCVRVFCDSLATCENLRDSSRDSLVAKLEKCIFCDSLATCKNLGDSTITKFASREFIQKIFATRPVAKHPKIAF